MRVDLAQLGTQAVPALIAAAQNGPAANLIAQQQADADAAYDVLQHELSKGSPAGSDPSDVASLQAQSRQDFIAQDMNQFVLSYRMRALQGVGVIGGNAAIQALQQFANDSSSPDLQAVAKEALAGISSAFSAELEISGGTSSGFELKAKFTLATSSDGINPLTEPVTVQVGTFFRIIPPGSFHLNQYGNFVFEGVINGAHLEAWLTPLTSNSFSFTAEGSGVDGTALTNPVPVSLAIGNDTGSTTVVAEHD